MIGQRVDVKWVWEAVDWRWVCECSFDNFSLGDKLQIDFLLEFLWRAMGTRFWFIWI